MGYLKKYLKRFTEYLERAGNTVKVFNDDFNYDYTESKWDIVLFLDSDTIYITSNMVVLPLEDTLFKAAKVRNNGSYISLIRTYNKALKESRIVKDPTDGRLDKRVKRDLSKHGIYKHTTELEKALRTNKKQEQEKYTAYYYKGTCFPLCYTNPTVEKIMEHAHNMIETGILHGDSLKQQKQTYLTQLDMIESSLCKHNGELTKLVKDIGQTEDELYAVWQLDICALLIMKVIKEDDDNGTMEFIN